jgi:equilibrative nucleoside transporter 1/2/3
MEIDNESGNTICGCTELTIARVMFIAIGIGYLFPFSALTQPVDYWTLLFPDFDVEFPITAVYMWTNLILLFLIVFYGSPKPNYDLRIYTGFVGQFFSLVVVPSSYFWGLSETGNYYIIMICTAFAAAVTAGIDSCIISLASLYPTCCQEALQIGIGVSTLIGSIYRIFTKLYFPPDAVVASSLLYFYSGAVTVLVCILCYYYLCRMDLTRRYLYSGRDAGLLRPTAQVSPMGTPVASPLMGVGEKPKNGGYGAVSATGEESARRRLAESDSYDRLADAEAGQHDAEGDDKRRMVAFSKVWWNEGLVFMCFATTLALWPPLVAEIPSYNFPSLNDTEWWPLILLFVFSLMDVIGRFSVPVRVGLNKDNIHRPIFARILIFVPSIVFCVKGWFGFTHDSLSVALVSFLGFTNGYLGSMSIVLTNEAVAPDERGVVGSLTGFVLNAGLVAGASAALILQGYLASM